MNLSRVAMSYDAVVERLTGRFELDYPPSILPEWFETSAFKDINVGDDGIISMRYYATPFTPLSEGESWTKLESGWVIQRDNLENGKTEIILSKTPRESITLYKSAIDVFSGEVSVYENINIGDLSYRDICHPAGSKFWYLSYGIEAS